MRSSPFAAVLLAALLLGAHPGPADAVGNPEDCVDGRCSGYAPAYNDTAYTNNFTGKRIAVGTYQGFAGSDYVVSLFNLSTNVPAMNTNWVSMQRYHGRVGGSGFGGWQLDTLGTVFGLTLDDLGNIYVCASSSYNGDAVGLLPGATMGTVYKIDRTTGYVGVFATLPNAQDPAWMSSPSEAWSGLGNITFDPVHNKLFVTNFEDGKIYRLDMSGTITATYDPFGPDNGLPGFAPLGERIWAVQWHADNRLYFSRWNAGPHEIWRMDLDGSGNFVPSTEALVITVPLRPSNQPSYPVSDISFTKQGHLLLAERQMYSDTYVSAHACRMLEYSCDLNTWYLQPGPFSIGNYVGPPYDGSAGGVDSDYRTYTAGGVDGRYWVTGDALHFGANDYIYGAQGLPPGTGNTSNSFLFDYNDNVIGGDKFELGDIEITCPVDTGSIHGGKFQDLDCDGKFDAGEPGVPNWPIVVTGPSGTFTIYTQANGSFHLWGLPNGTYTLCELGAAGWNQTMPATGCYTVVVNGNVTTGQLFGNCKPCDVQQQPCVKIPDTAVLWLPFDEPTGGVAHDPAGSNPGQIAGDLASIHSSPGGRGLSFRQQGHHVRVPDSPSLDFAPDQDFSLAAQFSLDDVAGQHFLFDKREAAASGPRGYALAIENGCVVARMQDGDAAPVFTSGPVVTPGTWHSVALSVRQAAHGLPPQGSVYLDGAELGTFDPAPSGSPPNMVNGADLRIGTNTAGTSVFGGDIDEPMVFARAITIGDAGIIWNPWLICKQWCKVPPTVNFGPYATTATATFTICNYDWSQPFMNYSWSLAGLPAGTCSVNGPVTYSPSSGSVNIPAGSCQNITVTITRPSWLVPGSTGCFVFNVTNNTKRTCFNCTSKATAIKKIWIDTGLDSIVIGHGGHKLLHLTLSSAEAPGTVRSVELQVSVGDAGSSANARYVALNGLPPGEPWIGQLLVSGGGSAVADVDVTYPVWSHLPDQWLVVRAYDEEGDSERTDIGCGEALLVDGEVLAVEPSPTGAVADAVNAWPNPARGTTHVRLSLARASHVKAAVYDVAGRTVRLLQRGTLQAGAHDLQWDGRDDAGRPVQAGLYFVRMSADGREFGARLVMMR